MARKDDSGKALDRKLKKFERQAKRLIKSGTTVGAGSVRVDIPGVGVQVMNLMNAIPEIVLHLMEIQDNPSSPPPGTA